MEVLKIILTKFSSRKFLTAIGGLSAGFLLILNDNVGEGVFTICTTIISYLIAEGYIDAKALPKGDEQDECSREED